MSYPAGGKGWRLGYEPAPREPRLAQTGAMQRRIRIGQELMGSQEGMTPRQIAAATGMTITSVNNDLRDMELLKLAERSLAGDVFRNVVNASKYVWRLTDLGRGAQA